MIALDHIDEVIRIIRNSETDALAQAELMERFDLSERQSQAILDMRLRRLTDWNVIKSSQSMTNWFLDS